MQLYTTAHVIQVFIIGLASGFFVGGLLISKLKPRKIIFIRPIQRKIPSAENTEYPIVS